MVDVAMGRVPVRCCRMDLLCGVFSKGLGLGRFGVKGEWLDMLLHDMILNSYLLFA